jgi:hypothetical protein
MSGVVGDRAPDAVLLAEDAFGLEGTRCARHPLNFEGDSFGGGFTHVGRDPCSAPLVAGCERGRRRDQFLGTFAHYSLRWPTLLHQCCKRGNVLCCDVMVRSKRLGHKSIRGKCARRVVELLPNRCRRFTGMRGVSPTPSASSPTPNTLIWAVSRHRNDLSSLPDTMEANSGMS